MTADMRNICNYDNVVMIQQEYVVSIVANGGILSYNAKVRVFA